jgi:hypothetical protein
MPDAVLEVLLAPLLVGASGLAAVRWREEVAGLVSAFPAIVGPLLLIAADAHGPAFAARTAAGTLLGLVALAAFALVYGHLARGASWRVALAGAWLAAAAASAVLVGLGHPRPAVAAVVALAALAVAHRALPPVAGGAAVRVSLMVAELPARMLVTALLVVALALAADRFGALVGGVLAALPVLASVLAVATHRGQGTAAVVDLLRGMLAGMGGFVAFCAVVALMVEAAGVPVAFALATAGCLLAQGLAYAWSGRRAVAPAG